MANLVTVQMVVQLEHYKMLKDDPAWKDDIRHQICLKLVEEILKNRAATITTYQSPYTHLSPYGEQVIKATISINLPEGNKNVY